MATAAPMLNSPSQTTIEISCDRLFSVGSESKGCGWGAESPSRARSTTMSFSEDRLLDYGLSSDGEQINPCREMGRQGQKAQVSPELSCSNRKRAGAPKCGRASLRQELVRVR